MTWLTPAFDELKMDAEIGSYQDDFNPPSDVPPFVAADPAGVDDAE